MTRYTVVARRWSGGWELHIDGAGVTQVATLAKAERQVRDYLATLHDVDTSTITVDIVPDLGGVGQRVLAVRSRVRKLESARREAAEETRQVVRELRANGLSLAETAAVLQVSKSRVQQLVR